MILQVRIPKGLQTHFSYVHTLKGFPVVVANGASWCKTALGLQSFWRVWRPEGRRYVLCTLCYRAGTICQWEIDWRLALGRL